MKTFKQFCADNFTNGEKTNTGNIAKEKARAVLDAETRQAAFANGLRAFYDSRKETLGDESQIKAARILRKGGYLTNCLTWKQAGRGV
jgi:hypothetical protein